jgi:hypothetical protein
MYSPLTEIKKLSTLPKADPGLIVPDGAMLLPHHYQELLSSAIDPEIISLNFKSLGGSAAADYLLPELDRRNDGRLRDADLKKYRYLEAGGWWCSGIDITTGEDSQWGSLKPDTPRIDREKQKPIKYEHPHGVPTQAFFLRIPPQIWEEIALRFGVALPDDYENLTHHQMWQWAIESNIPVVICEGAKKTASVLSQGYLAVGLPGIFSGYRSPKSEDGEPLGERFLIPQLQVLATTGRKIYFCFDQDEKSKTIKNVNIAILKTAKLFKAEDCETFVLDWNKQLGKGIDDVIFGGYDFNEIYRTAHSLNDWEVQQSRKLLREPNLQLNQRYLGDIPLPKNKIVAIKSPKNTGKTYTFQGWTELAIKAGERRVLIITHRINLGTQLADKLGVPYLSEVAETPEGSYYGLAMCIDSLHPNSQAKFNFEDWKGAYVVLDETVQLINHLLNSATCRKERVRIIKTFRSLLRFVIKTGGKILCADADLNDAILNFIQKEAGLSNDDVYLIDNDYKFNEPWNIYSFGGTNPAELIQVLDTQLAEGKKILLCLSGQKVKSKFGSQILESWFTERYPDLRILRIDSESVADKNHPAFGCVGRLNEIIKDYDLVLATPTIETGVSIEEKHFDSVFGIFQGVQAADSVRQFLSRYRPTVNRYIWVRETGINRIGSGSASVKSLLSGEYGKDRANIKRLTMVYAEYANGEDFDNIYLNTWAVGAAIHNIGMWKYRQQVLAGLKDEGHNIFNLIKQANDSELKKLIQDIKNHCDRKYLIYRVRVSEAESITDERFQQLDKQNFKTEKERLEYHKGRLERLYNIEITPDIVFKEDKKWGQQITLDYYFQTGREFLPDRENNVFRNALENGDGNYFKPDTNKSLMTNKIELLDQLKISELLALDEVSNAHPALVEFDEKCTELQYLIKRDLGIDLSKTKSAIQKYQRVINLIGYKIPRLRREGVRGSQNWVYGAASHDFERDDKGKVLVTEGKPIPILDERDRVFVQWLLRDQLAREKALAAVASPQTQPQPTGWKGAIFRLKSVVSGLDDFTQKAYNRIRSKVDGLLGTGDTEPYINTNNGNILTVWVNFAGAGAVAVPCEWLELST